MVWFDDLKTPRIKTQPTERASKVPEGLWVKCTRCGEMLQVKVLKENLQVCPECAYHFRLSAPERLALLCDAKTGADGRSRVDVEGSEPALGPDGALDFDEYGRSLKSTDPLHFDDRKPYHLRLDDAAQKTGVNDAFIAGRARLRGLPYHLGVFDFRFMGGSMGVVVGEKVTLVFEHALKERLPAVVVASSGGARMQEGILSLMQMAKTSALVQRLREEGIPYVSILTDPTTGGVAASFSMLGDVILAEPEALIGFAGPRVIEQTIRQSLPPGFQRSEFLLAHGFVDRITPRARLAAELREWMLRLGRNTCDFPAELS